VEVTSKFERVVAFDADWQYPAITEKQAYINLRDREASISADGRYFGFPWATLIDKLTNRPADASPLLSALHNLSDKNLGKRRVATVCQHIHLLKYQHLFDIAGVTDIFWCHKTQNLDFLPDYPAIRLHPFPLYPVQCANEYIEEDHVARPILYSFVGAKARDFYLSQARNYIIEELSGNSEGKILARDDWFYNEVVYSHQILGKSRDNNSMTSGEASAEFLQSIRESVFVLCPSGSGPNSIRLWETIAGGAVPVILADTIDLPSGDALWRRAAVFCGESRDDIKNLPQRLKDIAEDGAAMSEKRHALRQLWLLYNPHSFTYDVELLLMSDLDSPRWDGPDALPMSPNELLGIAAQVLNEDYESREEEDFLLLACTSRALIDFNSFSNFYAQNAKLRSALAVSAERHSSGKTAAQWLQVLKRIEGGAARPYASKAKHLAIKLAGRNIVRSPFSYPPYSRYIAEDVELTGSAQDADLIVFSASDNIREYYTENPVMETSAASGKLVVLSEEPLWDTTWGLDFDQSYRSLKINDTEIAYHVLNHFTTDIFDFEAVPYFLTTDDRYFVRYSNLFRRNAALTSDELLTLWRSAPIRQAYIAEKRTGERYDFKRSDLDLYGYCGYRTRLAEAAPDAGVLRAGMGWGAETRRQDLPDWHLDKLATLDRRTFIASALENTHFPTYITEKIFDAFAVLAVPIYAASAGHRIHDIVPQGTYINVFGESAAVSAEKLRSFEPDREFAERYLEAQRRLATLFHDSKTLLDERKQVAKKTIKGLLSVHAADAAGRPRRRSSL